MRKMKRISTGLIAVCFMMLAPFIQVFAADGTIQFSDPTTKAGEEVTVTAKITSSGGAIGDGTATISYDPAKLEFVSGTNAAGENGTITLSASGSGTETELNYSMIFKALSEGTATLSVTDSKAYLYSDEILNLQAGGSTVTIEAGSGNTAGQTNSAARGAGPQIEIDGATYTMDEGFTEALIPSGFSKTTVSIEGTERQCVVQDSSGKNLFFFTDAEGQDAIAFYNSEDGSFVLTEQVGTTDTFSLFLLKDGDGSALPSQYKETEMTVGGKKFPTWHNTEQPDFYLMYALNSAGEEDFYQYDDIDKTYQRFIASEQAEDVKSDTLLDKVKGMIDGNFILILCIVWGIFLIMLIIVIVLFTKLHNRNRELDDLYDEEYNENGEIKASKSTRNQFVGYDDAEDDDAKYKDEDDEYEDVYDDEYDDAYDEYEDDEYDDEYEDDEYDDEYEDDAYDDEYDEDEKSDFSIDFVDLDK